ncbi:hypothetical protein Y88_2924 [Novosphingobium nitrogenifigens DSM 19370]|uniref:Uncharacterized protein n=1 Tax=Novosphingobium nitrogenifigens DSM 19370 TaxID=983920 RepID=F1Z4K8_9SPHN|nr:hypothetical protein Y88_2924 [Novosphingobium nitrogenifigens DSM 19370]
MLDNRLGVIVRVSCLNQIDNVVWIDTGVLILNLNDFAK